MEVLAIIPARGGSERLPRKNLRRIGGRPLIAHSIEHAMHARLVNRTIVSTDNVEIEEVSRSAGAEVVRRPLALATDTATSESVVLHVLDYLEGSEKYQPDIVVFLQCTSPIRRPGDIDNAIGVLLDSGVDSLFSATQSKWLFWRSTGFGVDSFNYDFRLRKREQDRAAEWRENGSIFVFRPWVVRKHQNRLGGKIGIYEMDYWSSFQIDSIEDEELCDWILRKQQVTQWLSTLPSRIGAVVFDFDGVFTDNRVLVAQDGHEAVFCSRADGLGLDLLRETGLPIIVLSTERNPVVAERCQKLQIECRQGLADKAAALKSFAMEKNVPLSEVIYVGNDLNDRECLIASGCAIVVSDADASVRDVANIILTRAGGRGAVREVCDLVLKKLSEAV